MIAHLRSIAQHEARQLRAIPPRLWPLVKQERDCMVLLLLAHGRPVKTAPLNPDRRTRLVDAA